MVRIDRLIANDGVEGSFGCSDRVARPPADVGTVLAGCREDKKPSSEGKKLSQEVGGGAVVECRICQEEGEERHMEAPCACNGTLKVSSSIFSVKFSQVFLSRVSTHWKTALLMYKLSLFGVVLWVQVWSFCPLWVLGRRLLPFFIFLVFLSFFLPRNSFRKFYLSVTLFEMMRLFWF